MNRKIKFRGVSIENNSFVYGYFAIDEGESYIIDKDQTILVQPDSVAQFTGVLDKNGVEIYEGDSFSCNRAEYIVVWHDSGFVGKQKRSNSHYDDFYIGLEHWRENIVIHPKTV